MHYQKLTYHETFSPLKVGANTSTSGVGGNATLNVVVKNQNNVIITSGSYNTTGTFTNLNFTAVEGDTYTIEFYINNACKNTFFQVDNVFISHKEEMNIETGNFIVSGGYRYGFNGMEKDDNIKGEGNSYTTEFRQYDPRLGRWLSVDPLFANFPWQSPYVAFDNNPIYYIDPKGLAAEGAETHFVNEEGETLANTDDGSSEVFVIRKENEDVFIKDLLAKVETKEDLNPEINEELGEEYGYNIDEIKTEGAKRNYPKEVFMFDQAWQAGYETAYDGGILSPSLLREAKGVGVNYAEGVATARRHKKEGKMNIFKPQLKNKNAQNHIKTNKSTRMNHQRYSDKPIPLLIEYF